MTGIYLGLGSNLGDRMRNLARCLKTLHLGNEIQLAKVSSVYESEPSGYYDQPWFLNMAIEIKTKLEPLQLLKLIQQIEKRIGRKKTHHWGPRIIDIDILIYNNLILDHPMLNIPHRQLHLRQFVLLPLEEIAASFVHPMFNKNINQLLKECQQKAIVNWLMDGNILLKYMNNGTN